MIRKKTSEGREALNMNEKICLYSHEEDAQADFLILDEVPVGEGGSCVCYRALHRGQRGLLKEYYPVTLHVKEQRESGEVEVRKERLSLKRDGWKLRPVEKPGDERYNNAAKLTWEEAIREYRIPYEEILPALYQREDAGILHAYLVDTEVFYDEKVGGNIYIWIRHNAVGAAWNVLLDKIRRNAFREYDQMCAQDLKTIAAARSLSDGTQILSDILKTVKALAQVLQLLHNRGYVQRDIKPENILVLYDRSNHPNPSRVLLVDVDSIYPYEKEVVDGQTTTPSGQTVNFSCRYAPSEQWEGICSPRSDLYALVGCLYHAIAFSTVNGMGREEGIYANCLREDGCPDELECPAAELHSVSDSKHPVEVMDDRDWFRGEFLRDLDLIRSLEPAVRDSVSEELRRLFLEVLGNPQDPSGRFPGCPEKEVGQELIRRITRLERILQTNASGTDNTQVQGAHTRWLLEGRGHVDAEQIYRDLLYRYPVFQYIPEESTVADIMIIGSNKDSMLFLDMLLQVMQVGRCRLRVTVLTTDTEVRSKWNRERPGARNFLRIRGEDEPAEACYGELAFRYLEKERVKEMLEEAAYCMAFVCTDSDHANLYWAQLLHESMKQYGGIVHYICEDLEKAQDDEYLHSLRLHSSGVEGELSDELVEQAFNVHGIWAKPGMSAKQLRDEFYDKDGGYNFRASLAAAISIPYKMWDAGLDVSDSKNMAAEWHRIVQSLSSEDDDERSYAERILRELMALEHRRWIVDKITHGFLCMKALPGESLADRCVDIGKNFIEFQGNDRRGDVRGYHNCILPSTMLPGLPEDDGVRQDSVDEKIRKDYYDRWNRDSLETLENDLQGDALDLMNVHLHRDLKNYDMRRLCGTESPLDSGLWLQMNQLMEASPEGKAALHQMEHAVYQMVHCQDACMDRENRSEGERVILEAAGRNAVKEFRRAMNQLKKISQEDDGLRPLRRQVLIQTLGMWERVMYPLLQGNTYYSYKSADRRMVQGMAYIMTFRRHQQVAVKIGSDVSPEWMKAHTERIMCQVKPGRILFYLRLIEWIDEPEQAIRLLLNAVEAVKGQEDIPCLLKILITPLERAQFQKERSELIQACEYMQLVDAVQERVIQGRDRDSMAASCAEALKDMDEWQPDLLDDTVTLFRNEDQEEHFLENLQIPFFRYDRKDPTGNLLLTVGCEYLTYQRDI